LTERPQGINRAGPYYVDYRASTPDVFLPFNNEKKKAVNKEGTKPRELVNRGGRLLPGGLKGAIQERSETRLTLYSMGRLKMGKGDERAESVAARLFVDRS